MTCSVRGRCLWGRDGEDAITRINGSYLPPTDGSAVLKDVMARHIRPSSVLSILVLVFAPARGQTFVNRCGAHLSFSETHMHSYAGAEFIVHKPRSAAALLHSI